ncbi:MAG: hypothetical protein WAN35_18195 [Terracidiphilus sp.]
MLFPHYSLGFWQGPSRVFAGMLDLAALNLLKNPGRDGGNSFKVVSGQ